MNNSDKRLANEPLLKLIFSLAIPTIIGQVINVLYNIVDRIYIGHIQGNGDIVLTGVGVVMPIITLISAFSSFVGMGAAPLASIKLGENKKDDAEKILGNSVMLLIFIALSLTVIFTLFSKPILYLFGASDQSITYANTYCHIYVLGTLFVQATLGLNTFIVCQGKSKTAMCSILIGAVLNIILDPIFIFGFNFGVAGAAIATVISQFVSSIWVISFLFSKKSVIRIKIKYVKIDFNISKKVAALGISPFIMQSTESLVLITLNSGLQKYGGDMYVGAMTILTSVLQLIVIPMNGFNQGVQPVISYNYGANNKSRVKKCFKYMLTINLIMSCGATILACIFSRQVAMLFSSNDALVNLAASVLPIYVGGMWAFGAQSACQSCFVGLGQAKLSLFMALLRKIILLIPLAIIIPMIFGTAKSIFFAEPISDLLASATTFTIFMLNINKILDSKK
ncbi:MAG: MATE family efflux transporter [Lachnospirales bacterium]